MTSFIFHDPMPPLTLNDHVLRSATALSAEIDGEVVALDVEKGVCYGLNAVGARIWGLIERPVAIADVCDALEALYEVDTATCRADVLDLLGALGAEGLVEVRRSSRSA